MGNSETKVNESDTVTDNNEINNNNDDSPSDAKNLLDDSVIVGASYNVYEGDNGVVGGISGRSQNVSFYTFDGELLQTIKHDFRFPVIERKLDKNAPKPQPMAFAVVHWNAIDLGLGFKKGVPGYFIIFYDKNGNKIHSYRYDLALNTITVFNNNNTTSYYKFEKEQTLKDFPLDLSICSKQINAKI